MSVDIHATDGVAELLRPIMAEMGDRLEGELSYNDMLALQSAVAKSACAAYRAGLADVVMGLVDEGFAPPSITFAEHEDDPDPWHDEFGHE